MKQRPELSEVVLKRGTGDEETICGLVQLELTNKSAIEVLDAVSLIDNDELPAKSSQKLAVIHANLITCDHDRKLFSSRVFELRPAHLLALLLVAVVQ
jgi:hypothetical protein